MSEITRIDYNSSLDEFKDPFNSDNVRRIEFTIENDIFGDKGALFKSRISFRNGDTSGYQSLESDTFNGIVEKTNQFINSFK